MKTITEPIINRRIFFEIASAGVAGYFLSPLDVLAQAGTTYQKPAVVMNSARYAIFILLAGAPSHVDTFDLKVGPWTPANFQPTTFDGVDFPAGLLPNLSYQWGQFAFLRSCQSNALVHSLLQTWNQIARNPTTSTGKIAPNIGSIVALEFDSQRRRDQVLPGFVSLNTGGNLIRNGYLPARYSPFDVTANAGGLTNLQHPDGQVSFGDRRLVVEALNSVNPVRVDFDEMRDFYTSAQSMMYDPAVNNVFRFSPTDQQRYGNSGFGNSCIVARNLIAADLGTRYFQINLGGWDNHSNIYQANAGIYNPARQLDQGLANLIADLAIMPGSNGRSQLDQTLIVVKGEFGRTVGSLNGQQGRDHYAVHTTLFAGGGVRGGRAMGTTTADGRFVDSPGWSQERPVAPEDIAATIYSALGINYTTQRRDDPLGRGFEYVPSTSTWPPYPVVELFQ
ncbi:MAG: hypothetical protein DMG13_08385 [Acidobacteria bacterium]|nr:MAG: hypothetical protein DMG13_08385 [Acidobacteriota bacterium]